MTFWLHPKPAKKTRSPARGIRSRWPVLVGKGTTQGPGHRRDPVPTPSIWIPDSAFFPRGSPLFTEKAPVSSEILEDYNDDHFRQHGHARNLCNRAGRSKLMEHQRCQTICDPDRLTAKNALTARPAWSPARLKTMFPKAAGGTGCATPEGSRAAASSFNPASACSAMTPPALPPARSGATYKQLRRAGGHRSRHDASDAATASPPAPTAPGFATRLPASADKCDFCPHRLKRGEEPACVKTCPTKARVFGDLNDPQSKVSELIKREKLVQLVHPVVNTRPSIYYSAGTLPLDWPTEPTLPGNVYMSRNFWKTTQVKGGPR